MSHPPASHAARARERRGLPPRTWAWLAAGLAAGAALALLPSLVRRETSPRTVVSSRRVIRSTIDLAGMRPEPRLADGVVSISPDGSRLLLAAGLGRSRLYLRRLDSLALEVLPGTTGAWTHTAFSPDGRWMVFWNFDTTLTKIPVDGGVPIRMAQALDYWGGCWDHDGTFVFAPDTGSGLRRVPAAGGDPEIVTQVDRAAGEVSHRFPSALPGGRGLLYSVKVGADAGDWRIVALSYETGAVVPLVEGGYNGRSAPTGHLVYGSGGSIYAVPMELDPPRVDASPVPVVQGVEMAREHGTVSFAFSDDGTLAYIPTSIRSAYHTPVWWVDRSGRRELATTDRRTFFAPRLSPDGSRLAITVEENQGWDVYVYDLERGVASRLTTGGNNQAAVWTPDGERIVFQSNRSGNFDLYWQRADGGDEAVILSDPADAVVFEFPTSMSPDGTLAFSRQGSATDVWTLRAGSDEKATPFLATPEDEANGVFSPDGSWIAYEVMQGERPEIFVQPYPAGGRRVKISSDGGASPVWSRSTPELFYMEDGERMMAVAYEVSQGELRPGAPRPLFEAAARNTGWPAPLFDVSADGRFLIPEATDLARARVVLVQNWFVELERLVPTK